MAGALAGVMLALVVALVAAQADAKRAPSRLMVSGNEWSLTLSRQRIRRGPALIQFLNRGEDPHDLRLRKIGRRASIDFPELRPGKLAQIKARLSVGRYRLWCSLPGHARRGMRATLRVRRHRR